MLNEKDVGCSTCSLIPREGSRIALTKDKQLELAHAVWYYTNISFPFAGIREQGHNTPNVDASVAFLLVIDLRDLHVEENDA